MPEFGLFLSSEEHGPRDLVRQAQQAADAGFTSVMISDHYHPWVEQQGESPFVWSVIGAIAATTELKITTGVTCPTVRIHPAIIAQAAATSQLLTEGRFCLGVGSGEALNEHIFGEDWPAAHVRIEMLEEAIEIIRELWTGRMTTYRGRYYTVDNAKLYSVPDEPPPILVSAFGPEALRAAARIGDGLVTVHPDKSFLRDYNKAGGSGPRLGLIKVCWDNDEERARAVAHERWAVDRLPGQLNQELRTPALFEQAATLVSEDMVADTVACGPDPQRHLDAIHEYLDAGFDEIYISQIGDDLTGFLDFWTRELSKHLHV